MKKKGKRNRKNQKIKRKSAGTNKGCGYKMTGDGRFIVIL
jgi:hypothetical protein